MSNQPGPHPRNVFPQPGQGRPPAPHQVARALYGSAFHALDRGAVEQSMLDFRKLNPKDQLFIVGHLLYLQLQAEAGTQRALAGAKEMLHHVAGATYAIADEVTRPRLEQEYDAAMATQAEGALAEAMDLAEAATAGHPMPALPQTGEMPEGAEVEAPAEAAVLALVRGEEGEGDVQP